MHKFIAFFSLAGATLCGYQMTCSQPSPSVYKIDFSGKQGEKLTGAYIYKDPKGTEMGKIKHINATLPYSVTFSPPAGYKVVATAIQNSEGTGPISITIYKDGVDCTKEDVAGSGSMLLSSCDAR